MYLAKPLYDWKPFFLLMVGIGCLFVLPQYSLLPSMTLLISSVMISYRRSTKYLIPLMLGIYVIFLAMALVSGKNILF